MDDLRRAVDAVFSLDADEDDYEDPEAEVVRWWARPLTEADWTVIQKRKEEGLT